jgi:hypothetical protein
MNPSKNSPELYLYYNADRTIAIQMKDAQQEEFDFSKFESIRLNVFQRSQQNEPPFSVDYELGDDDTMLFKFTREQTQQMTRQILYYELEYFAGGKRDVWIANRFHLINVPDTPRQDSAVVTISDDLVVVNVEGAMSVGMALWAAERAEGARDEATTKAQEAEQALQDLQGTIITSASFVGDDIVFTKQGGDTVVLEDAAILLKGEMAYNFQRFTDSLDFRVGWDMSDPAPDVDIENITDLFEQYSEQMRLVGWATNRTDPIAPSNADDYNWMPIFTQNPLIS